MLHEPDAGEERDLIYDWNTVDYAPPAGRVVELDDETLRDGLQSPSVTQPGLDEKKQLLHLMVELGIQAADIGLPGAGPQVAADVTELACEIGRHKLPIVPNCAARTLAVDIEPIVDAVQASGVPIEAALFIGSSPIRQYVENWTLDQIMERSEKAIKFAIDHGLSVMYVTEDTTRSSPDSLRRIFTHAINCGARRICIADTVGHITRHGTMKLIGFMRNVVQETGEKVMIDWHGHRDRGLALENSLAAIEAGADRVHGTALGIGERSGNTPMEHLLINFKLMGLIDHDLTKLAEYCDLVSRACSMPIPANHPVIGNDAFRTSTGVHAAAVIKAIKKGEDWLANRVYSGVPASWTGRQQVIEIGPMSGASNVTYWLQTHDIEPEDALVEEILRHAKENKRLLTEEQVMEFVHMSKH